MDKGPVVDQAPAMKSGPAKLIHVLSSLSTTTLWWRCHPYPTSVEEVRVGDSPKAEELWKDPGSGSRPGWQAFVSLPTPTEHFLLCLLPGSMFSIPPTSRFYPLITLDPPSYIRYPLSTFPAEDSCFIPESLQNRSDHRVLSVTEQNGPSNNGPDGVQIIIFFLFLCVLFIFPWVSNRPSSLQRLC